jgi:xylulokinase
MQADILGLPVTTMHAEEGPAFGAALLAGVGTRVYRDVAHAVDAAVRTGDTITPNVATQQVYGELYAVYRSLYGALQPAFGALGKSGEA